MSEPRGSEATPELPTREEFAKAVSAFAGPYGQSREPLLAMYDTLYVAATEIREEDDALRAKLAGILTRTANALKGEPAPLQSHSWHDLPEVAASFVRKRDKQWLDAVREGETPLRAREAATRAEGTGMSVDDPLDPPTRVSPARAPDVTEEDVAVFMRQFNWNLVTAPWATQRNQLEAAATIALRAVLATRLAGRGETPTPATLGPNHLNTNHLRES